MNSWNKTTSLAYNLKVYNLSENNKIIERLYQLLEGEEGYLLRQKIDNLIYQFGVKHDYEWQARFNGASAGYLVLYSGRINDDGRVFIQVGREHTEKDVPGYVKKDFRRLAQDIQKVAIETAKNILGVKND